MVLLWLKAGLQEGDIIKEYQGYHIDLARDLYLYMYLNNPQEDETIHMTVGEGWQRCGVGLQTRRTGEIPSWL